MNTPGVTEKNAKSLPCN